MAFAQLGRDSVRPFDREYQLHRSLLSWTLSVSGVDRSESNLYHTKHPFTCRRVLFTRVPSTPLPFFFETKTEMFTFASLCRQRRTSGKEKNKRNSFVTLVIASKQPGLLLGHSVDLLCSSLRAIYRLKVIVDINETVKASTSSVSSVVSLFYSFLNFSFG